MIKIAGVTKTYGKFTAVDDVSFECKTGQVTGFLGPNGAGKSTTMRILAGLTIPDRGTALIDGRDYRHIPNPGRSVGVLLDASAQHAGRTGREILTMAAMTLGLHKTRVDEMLEMVGLSQKEAKRRVKNYSLGMRQRLGLAHSLIGDPSVLILDEPANGLDPAGIHWMRQLLRYYADQGGTVMLSSHLLREVEVIADELIVIGHGRIVAQGTMTELLQKSGTVVRASDVDRLGRALNAAGIAATPTADGGFAAEADPAEVGQAAAAAGVALSELRSADGAGLEELFLQLTSSTQRDEANGALS